MSPYSFSGRIRCKLRATRYLVENRGRASVGPGSDAPPVVDLGHAPGSVVAKPLTKEIYPRTEKDSGDTIVHTVVAPGTDGPYSSGGSWKGAPRWRFNSALTARSTRSSGTSLAVWSRST